MQLFAAVIGGYERSRRIGRLLFRT